MSYLFNTPEQVAEMLAAIGVPDLESLFDTQIPRPHRLDRPLDLPAAQSELELESFMRQRAADNDGIGSRTCFMGGGVYDHFIVSGGESG